MTSPSETRTSAQLVLESGTVFRGLGFGASIPMVGEVCFNTGMCGYQEVLTDPSYAGQIVVMTAPQIGNYGISDLDEESGKPQVAGFVVRNLSRPSNWRSVDSLEQYLQRHHIPGLFDVDTRQLTRLLREVGAQKGAIGPGNMAAQDLQKKAQQWRGLENVDFVQRVTCSQIYEFAANLSTSSSELRQSTYEVAPGANMDASALHIVVYDFGVKKNILHRLASRGCRVTVVPAATPAQTILEWKPHGVLLSNGPGDPQAVGYAIETVRELIGKLPIFGICLGHQILGLALGGRRIKLKFGHRGVNHPVADRDNGKVRITSQNHGFALDARSLAALDVEITETSLNDQTVEAMRHRSLPVFSVQYHPEAAPGPHDNDAHFDQFLQLAASAAGVDLTPIATRAGGKHAAA